MSYLHHLDRIAEITERMHDDFARIGDGTDPTGIALRGSLAFLVAHVEMLQEMHGHPSPRRQKIINGE
jgi:hypothetical protein